MFTVCHSPLENLKVHSFNPPLPLEMIGQYNVNIMVVIQDCTAVVTVAVSTGSA